MILLAVDTSGKNGSLAVVRASESGFDVLELVPLEGRMYSAQLIPEIQNALCRQNLKKSDIDAYAVASGPGSFTGLRVGLSTVKALSEVLHKPIAAVSVLEATARMAGCNGQVMVGLDAGRKQAFVGDYEFGDDFRVIRAQESIVTLEVPGAKAPGALIASGAAEAAPFQSSTKIFSPDQTVRDMLAAQGIRVEEVEAPRAEMFARIGYEQIIRGETTPAGTLEANYIRASDAELFSLPKLMS